MNGHRTDGDEPYRVLLVIQSLRTGGAETMVATLARGLLREGVNVRLVVLQAGRTPIREGLERDGVDVRVLAKRPGPSLRVIKDLAREIRDFAPDVIHSHLPILHYVVPAAVASPCRNLVHTVHSLADRETSNPWKRRIASLCFRTGIVRAVALSEVNRESIARVHGVSESCVAVVRIGIDRTHFIPRKVSGHEGAVRLCHIGRFTAVKNHAMLIATIQCLHARGCAVTLDLYGDGPLLPDIERRVLEEGHEDVIRFHGETQDVPAALARADVFVLPSKWEGAPMVVAEAMAAGVPVVATRVGGLPDMVRDGEDGFLVDFDPELMAEAIMLLADDGQMRERLGRSARERSDVFDVSSMVRGYLTVYRDE